MSFNEIISNLNFSNITWQIATPLIFSLCDIISGYIQAIINKSVDSQKMREGLLHKSLILLIIILSFIVHYTFNLVWVSKVVCIYVIFMESFSILENLKKAGINFGKLSDVIKTKPEQTTEENINSLVEIIKENKESEANNENEQNNS